MRNLFLSLALTGALLLPFGVAQANDSIPVHVDLTGCENITSTRTAGHIIFDTGVGVETWIGSFSGSFASTERDTIYPDGTVRFRTSGTFSGQVAGQAGSFAATFEGVALPDGSFSGHWVAHQGSGELQHLQAQGDFSGGPANPRPGCDVPYRGTFSGAMHFEA